MTLRIPLVTRLLRKAEEMDTQDDLWQIWLTKYPYMGKDNFVTFEDFLEQVTRPVSQRSANEIISESKEIRRKLGKGW